MHPYITNVQLAGVRDYFRRVYLATNFFGSPGLDLKGIVEDWANGEGKDAGMECDVDVEETSFFLDPHIWGVIYKKTIERDPDYEPTNAEKRRMKKRQQAGSSSQPKGFSPRQK